MAPSWLPKKLRLAREGAAIAVPAGTGASTGPTAAVRPGGYGKCLVDVAGNHICAEFLFQASSCSECEQANCTDCRCVPASGGTRKCNNGANGYDFICVRKV